MTPEEITLPERLTEVAGNWEQTTVGDLLTEAADRICDLEEELLQLRRAVVGHRGHRDYVGGKIQADLDLWEHVADVPWGKPIKGDG